MLYCYLFSNQKGRLPYRQAKAIAAIIIKNERKKYPVNIIFSDDKLLKKLNSRFRRKKRTTDVLSFPADPETGLLGEIYISIDTARRQATTYDTTLGNEVLRLVCHGLLHLCGYDHHRKNDTIVMRAKEDHYLKGFLKNA